VTGNVWAEKVIVAECKEKVTMQEALEIK